MRAANFFYLSKMMKFICRIQHFTIEISQVAIVFHWQSQVVSLFFVVKRVDQPNEQKKPIPQPNMIDFDITEFAEIGLCHDGKSHSYES